MRQDVWAKKETTEKGRLYLSIKMVATKCIEKLIVLTWVIICCFFFEKKKHRTKIKQSKCLTVMSFRVLGTSWVMASAIAICRAKMTCCDPKTQICQVNNID